MGQGNGYGLAFSGRWAWVARGVVLAGAMLWAGLASAAGSVALNNGATVNWRLEPDAPAPRFALALPAFAYWTSDGFREPAPLAIRSNAMAAVEAWEVGVYRASDTAFARPLWRQRGAAQGMGQPLSWDGTVESGPNLRPGETVVARLSVRDVAGTLSHTEPLEMLVARYMMPRERDAVAARTKKRRRALSEGEALRVPVQGQRVILTVTDWPGERGPSASGVPLIREGKEWVLDQMVPPGAHSLVIQSLRPIMGGYRAIPVGIVAVNSPPAPPLEAAIKGTGSLAKMPITGGLADVVVPGRQALTRMLIDRDSAEDRLALALVDPDRPVPLAADARGRRVLLVTHGAMAAPWPGQGDVQPSLRDPAPDPGQRVRLSYAPPVGREVFLPHTAITPGSVRLFLEGGGGALTPDRDYFVNPDEGRVLLGETMWARVQHRGIEIAYTAPSFARSYPVGMRVMDGGSAFVGGRAVESEQAAEEPTGIFSALGRWLFGGG